jgi:hypothetical protein
VAIPAESLRLSGECLSRSSAPLWRCELGERRGERVGVIEFFDDPNLCAQPFRRSVGGTRHDRPTRRRCFERHIGEGVVAGWEHDRVDGVVEHVEVASLTQEAQLAGDTQPRGSPLPGTGIITTSDPDPMSGAPIACERLHQPVESFSMPARSGEEPEGSPIRIGIFESTHFAPVLSGAVGSKTSDIDAIWEQEDSVAIDTLFRDEFIGDQARAALDTLAWVREDATLGSEQDAVAGREVASLLADWAMISAQVVGMTAPSGAIEILVPRAAETVDDVESTLRRSGRRSRRGPIEGANAQRLPEGWNPDRGHGNAGLAADFACDHCDVLASTRQLVGNLPRYVLDSTEMGSEALDDDRDTQWESSGWMTEGARRVERYFIPWSWLRHRSPSRWGGWGENRLTGSGVSAMLSMSVELEDGARGLPFVELRASRSIGLFWGFVAKIKPCGSVPDSVAAIRVRDPHLHGWLETRFSNSVSSE